MISMGLLNSTPSAARVLIVLIDLLYFARGSTSCLLRTAVCVGQAEQSTEELAELEECRRVLQKTLDQHGGGWK